MSTEVGGGGESGNYRFFKKEKGREIFMDVDIKSW